jgi:hypothetical protein
VAAHPTISDGRWEVGVDVAAGVDKVKEAITSGNCYWNIGPTAGPGKIIENEVDSGGRPTVTLSKDEDFTTTRCGTWAKRWTSWLPSTSHSTT